MKNRIPYRILGVLLILLMTGLGVVAQEAVIVGDADAESLEIVQNYLQTRDPNLLAEDAQYTDPVSTAPITGRDVITQTQDNFYGQTFSESLATPIRYIVAEDGIVVVEFEFTGTNTGEFADQPPTGANVLVPMVGIYTVETGQIINMQIYYDSNALYTQLGYTYGPAPGGAVAPIYSQDLVGYPMWVGDITEDPVAYYDQEVVVDGYVGRALDASSFILYQDEFLGAGHEVIVFDNSGQGQEFIQLADTRVRVVGVVRDFVAQDIEAELGYDLDENAFADVQELTVIVASSITNVETVETIGHIVDNPEAYYEQEVTINGLIGDFINPQAFTIYQDQLIGIRGEVLVIDNSGQQELTFAELPNANIRVQGTVYAPSSEIDGVDLSDPGYDPYRDMVVIVADEIALAQTP